MPRKAVFTLEKPLEAAGGVRLTFKLVQNHGGWNSDDNQNNNLGRFRFSVTSAENAVADPLPADVRAILQMPAAERTAEQTARVFSYWRTTVPEWQEENGGSRRCGRAIRRARRSSRSRSANSRARRIGWSAATFSRRQKR